MWILTVNSGSSSIKYSLFKVQRKKLKLTSKGIIERIGEEKSFFRIFNSGVQKVIAKNHKQAIRILLEFLLESKDRLIEEKSLLLGIGHRVVHGGNEFRAPVLIDKKVINCIKKYSDLAPLHNPPELLGIKACLELLPKIPQIAVFDTAFHQTIPKYAYIYAIPYKFYKNYGIRRYGFHGISHEYVAEEASHILKKPLSKLKLITCHLGNGCSITCVKKSKVIDTSMGFTPLEGLVMGTRSGDIDPAIIFYLIEKGFSPKKVEEILNKKSGLLGLSGISNDMRTIEEKIKKKNPRAKLTYQVFLYRLLKYISSYIGVLGGCNAVILTAGIGENEKRIKEDIEKNLKPILSKFRTKVLIIPTNEELMIARQVLKLLKTIGEDKN
jgi:acetate kinase